MMHRKPQTHRKDEILLYKSRSYFFGTGLSRKFTLILYIRLGWKLGKSGNPLTWSLYLMTGQSQTGKITKFPLASWVFRTWVVCCRNEAVSPPFRALVNAWICLRPPMDSPNWESKQKSSWTLRTNPWMRWVTLGFWMHMACGNLFCWWTVRGGCWGWLSGILGRAGFFVGSWLAFILLGGLNALKKHSNSLIGIMIPNKRKKNMVKLWKMCKHVLNYEPPTKQISSVLFVFILISWLYVHYRW